MAARRQPNMRQSFGGKISNVDTRKSEKLGAGRRAGTTAPRAVAANSAERSSAQGAAQARLTIAVVAAVLLANSPAAAQLTFVTPVEPQFSAAGSNAWVASDEGRIDPESILESLAPGEVLVEPSIVHDLAARPGGSFAASASQPAAPSAGPLTSRGGLSVPPQPTHPAVVRVVAADFGGASLGSGTLVDVNEEHGLVVTNWHVVRDAPGNVIVVFPDGFQSLGRVLRMDANWDLAAILINKPHAAPVRLAAQAPQIGETLTIAGYGGGSYRAVAGPCTQYLAPSVQHPQELVELAASARQGDSGGPIFNARGELAGVLFGEAGGRTTGAYCGRVHSFLAAAVKELYERDGSQLAGPPDRVPSQASTSVAGLSMGSGSMSPQSDPKSQDRLAAAGPEYWQNSGAATRIGPSSHAEPSKPMEGQVAEDSTLNGGPTADAAETLAAASFYAAAPPRDQPVDWHSTGMGPVAAIESPAVRDATTFSQSRSESPDRAGPTENRATNPEQHPTQSATGLETGSLTWRFFAGETLIAQIKTVLACIGMAAILLQGTRAVARTSANAAKGPARRAKK